MHVRTYALHTHVQYSACATEMCAKEKISRAGKTQRGRRQCAMP